MNKITGNRKEKPPKNQRDQADFTLTTAQQNEVIREWLRWSLYLPFIALREAFSLSFWALKQVRHMIYVFFTE